MAKCPRCGTNATVFYKCDFCGDMRCNSTANNSRGEFGCATAKGGGRVQAGTICKVCKKGKYQKM